MDPIIIAAIIGAAATFVVALAAEVGKPEWFTGLAARLGGKRRLSWDALESGLERISNHIESEGYDFIVSVAGSGGMLANWLYRERDRTVQTFVALQERNENPWVNKPSGHHALQGNRWTIHVPAFLDDFAKGKRVLVLDSGYATGETALLITKHLEAVGALKVRYACMVYVKNVGPQTRRPDFFVYEFDSSNFYYPWGKAV